MKQEFLERMKMLLQEEYPAFEASLEEPLYRGVRINPLKISKAQFLQEFPYQIRQTPFCKDAFYLDHDASQVGNHPLHMAGACYMQEPSASSAVEALDVVPGEWVLDLCAAPGGKSTQIAGKLQNQGVLVSNEIEPKRAQILLSNMERLGVGEAVITNAHPKDLCSVCAGWFDKVLVDAPCSGEGMMKKHDAAMEHWSQEAVEACANRQVQILDSAFDALKEGGILVYSTCTYAMEENEGVIARILRMRDDIEQLDCDVTFGRTGFACDGMDASKVRRIFPMDHGEGHFVARLRKCKGSAAKRIKQLKSGALPSQWQQELQKIITVPKGYFLIENNKMYFRNQPFLDLGKLRVLRQGVVCGELVKGRIEPHQHLFVSAQLRSCIKQEQALNDEQCKAFVKGEQLFIEGVRGYAALTWHDLVIGFGKGDGTVIKNKLPKGLRRHLK